MFFFAQTLVSLSDKTYMGIIKQEVYMVGLKIPIRGMPFIWAFHAEIWIFEFTRFAEVCWFKPLS
jgi:hypothetical protein